MTEWYGILIRDREGVHRLDERVFGRKGIDAGGKSRLARRISRRDDVFRRRHPQRKHIDGKSGQRDSKPSHPVRRQSRATMRGRTKNNPANIGSRSEDQHTLDNLFILGVHGHLVWRFAKVPIPESHAAVRNHQTGDHTAHAMPDQNDFLVIGIGFINPVQFFPQQFCRIRERITAWIAKDPELIVLVDDRIAPEFVQQRRPGRRGILQPMGHAALESCWDRTVATGPNGPYPHSCRDGSFE